MVYSYKHGFSGFAAKLTESEAEKIAGIVNMSSSISINISTRWSLCICVYKIVVFQSCLVLFKSCQTAFSSCKLLGVGIGLASLLNLIPIFFTRATKVMELL